MRDSELIAKWPSLTLNQALAQSLRDMMAINGKPLRSDPHYGHDPNLCELHLRQWERAVEALRWFEKSEAEKP